MTAIATEAVERTTAQLLKPRERQTSTLGVRFSAETLARLTALADSLGATRGELVRAVVERVLLGGRQP